MEDLVTAEVGIVPAGPLDRIEHTAHRVEDSARQEPEKSGGGEHLSEGNQSHQRHPPHKEAQSRSHPAGSIDPEKSQRKPRQGQEPGAQEEGHGAATLSRVPTPWVMADQGRRPS